MSHGVFAIDDASPRGKNRPAQSQRTYDGTFQIKKFLLAQSIRNMLQHHAIMGFYDVIRICTDPVQTLGKSPADSTFSCSGHADQDYACF